MREGFDLFDTALPALVPMSEMIDNGVLLVVRELLRDGIFGS